MTAGINQRQAERLRPEAAARPLAPVVDLDASRRKGPDRSGENNGFAKLTADDVREIRRSEASHIALAIWYGVTPANIGHIRARRTWKGVA